MLALDRIAFWRKPEPAPSGECAHLWSNWSEPVECEVRHHYTYSGTSTERAGWSQDRHCLKCNIYERRLA